MRSVPRASPRRVPPASRFARAGRAPIAALLGPLLLSACGYTLSARPPLPEGIEAVSIPVLENDTPETEVGVVMARALASRAESGGRLAGRGGGAGTLAGRVELIQASPVAFPAAADGAGMYALRLRVGLRLIPPGGGAPVMELTVDGREQYLAGREPGESEANRRLALERLCERLADEAWGRLTAPP